MNKIFMLAAIVAAAIVNCSSGLANKPVCTLNNDNQILYIDTCGRVYDFKWWEEFCLPCNYAGYVGINALDYHCDFKPHTVDETSPMTSNGNIGQWIKK